MARDSSKTPVTKPRKKRKHPQASTTGKADPQVDQTNWRVGLQTRRIKFDDAQKAIYLHELARNGLKGRSAFIAGVAPQTVNAHIKNDPADRT